MVIKTKYTAKDYNADIVEENIKRLSRGEPIIEEGSPEYKRIIRELNKDAAKHTIGVSAIQDIVINYDKNGELSEGGQAIGIEPQKNGKPDNRMYG